MATVADPYWKQTTHNCQELREIPTEYVPDMDSRPYLPVNIALFVYEVSTIGT